MFVKLNTEALPMKYVTETGHFQRIAFSITANEGNKGVYFFSSTDAKEC